MDVWLSADRSGSVEVEYGGRIITHGGREVRPYPRNGKREVMKTYEEEKEKKQEEQKETKNDLQKEKEKSGQFQCLPDRETPFR